MSDSKVNHLSHIPIYRKIHYHLLPFLVVFSIVIIIAVILTGCGTSPGNTDSGTANNNSNSIGPAGGTVTSSDGKVKLVIPSGALNKDTDITFSAASNQPAGNIGTAYEVNPDDTTFTKPVTISIIYDEASLPSGVSESDIKLGTVTNNQWEAITDSFVNTASNTISGSITHLSTYGIVAVNTGSVPTAPTGIAVTAGDGKVTISWDAVQGATSYNIYWSTTSGVTKTTGTKIAGATTPYTHTGRTNGTTYYYVVTAVNSHGESGESNMLTVTPMLLPIILPKTGQNNCYDISGSIIDCFETGQDGELQKGVAWPKPRFIDNNNGTVTDKLTVLMWTKDANDPGSMICSPTTSKTWKEALDYVSCLNTYSFLGYTDWRLPNVSELESLVSNDSVNPAIPKGHPFLNIQNNLYWSSTNFRNNGAWVVGMNEGQVDAYGKIRILFVWPVRTEDKLSNLPQTGQTTCFDSDGNLIVCDGTGQDGDTLTGIELPIERFIDHGNGTVTDKLTGLMWPQNANLLRGFKTWQEGIEYIKGMNRGVYPNFNYTDWRLPNRKELQSLIDRGRLNPAMPSNHTFVNIQADDFWDYYWTSTTSYSLEMKASWVVGMFSGKVLATGKTGSDRMFYNGWAGVWPVRSEQ